MYCAFCIRLARLPPSEPAPDVCQSLLTVPRLMINSCNRLLWCGIVRPAALMIYAQNNRAALGQG